MSDAHGFCICPKKTGFCPICGYPNPRTQKQRLKNFLTEIRNNLIHDLKKVEERLITLDTAENEKGD